MESLSLEEENLIEDIRNLFRLKKRPKQLKIDKISKVLKIFLSMKKRKLL